MKKLKEKHEMLKGQQDDLEVLRQKANEKAHMYHYIKNCLLEHYFCY